MEMVSLAYILLRFKYTLTIYNTSHISAIIMFTCHLYMREMLESHNFTQFWPQFTTWRVMSGGCVMVGPYGITYLPLTTCHGRVVIKVV